MQSPSAKEIEREVAALRDIRRRSSQQGPGSIPLDPDLPPNGPASASAGGYWDNYTPPPGSREGDTPGSVEGSEEGSDDPSHLFWVPAHLHPEIAPAEFRAFLKEHTNAAPGDDMPLARSLSSSSGLGRKRSMLSKQYTPRAGDGVEEEQVVTVKRNRSSIYSTAGPQLTISDLQKLEQLAEEAAMSDDPSKLRSVLRRSLSLNVAPSFIDQMDGVPEEDDADAPIIVPRPGQILRRTARTKIRKPGLAGDGGGHRFASTRRGARAAKPDIAMPNEDGRESDSARTSAEKPRDSDERPISYADEAFILDAYGDRRDSMASNPSSTEEDDLTSAASHSSAPTTAHQSSSHEKGGQRPISPSVDSSISGQTVRRVSPPPSQRQPEYHQPQPVQPQPPVLHHPTPQRHLEVPQQGAPSRTPSPSSEAGHRPAPSTSPDPFRRSPSAPPQSTPSSASTIGPSSVSPAPSLRSNKSSHKEKEKKGLLKGMWGGEKKKEKEKEKDAGSKGNEGGFFGSLFGGGKKKQEEEPRGLLAGAGPAAAAALLGASKAKQASPPSPGPNNYSRYPIHVERAVYRLSHIKLANPRRPLYEQVLISNLMFWYLGVINKVTPPAGAAKEGNGPEGAKSDEDKEKAERERLEKEKQEREEKERVEKERLEREREREQKEREREREGKKRGNLVKSVPPGSGPGGGRRAEMPVRGPQYDVQHRQIEQEGGFHAHHPPGGRPPMGRPPGPSAEGGFGMDGRGPPPMRGQPPMAGPPQYHGQPPFPPQGGPPYPQQYPPGAGGPQSQATNYMQFAPSLPPGAMPPPASGSPEPWMGSSSTSRDSPYAAAAPMGGPNRSRSPPARGPPPNGPGSPPGGGARLVQRSISANAGGPPPPQQQYLGPGPGRPPMQRGGPPGPPGPPNGAGGWGPPPQQRRGSSPNPPAGARRPRTADSDDRERSMEWQQPQRGGPIVR